MSIQSISHSYQTQLNSLKSDFQRFSKNVKALQSAFSSGNQDQVTISENALSASLTQIMSGFSSNAPTQSSAGSSSLPQSPMQTFQNDLQTLQSTLSSTSGNQGTSSNTTGNTAVTNVLNDLTTMKSHGHHHHHHHSGGNISGTSTFGNSQSQDAMQTLLSDLQSLQNTLTPGTQSQTATTAVGNVLNDISKFMQQHSVNANNIKAINISA